VAALRCFADGAHIAMRKRAWPRPKIIPVKWFNLAGKCSRGRPPHLTRGSGWRRGKCWSRRSIFSIEPARQVLTARCHRLEGTPCQTPPWARRQR
jgi:hypothetical protein